MALSFMALYVHSANTCNQYNTLVIIQTHTAHLSTVVNTKTTKLTHQSESQHPYKKGPIVWMCCGIMQRSKDIREVVKVKHTEEEDQNGKDNLFLMQFMQILSIIF